MVSLKDYLGGLVGNLFGKAKQGVGEFLQYAKQQPQPNFMRDFPNIIQQPTATPAPTARPTISPRQQQVLSANSGRIPDAGTFYNEGFDKIYPEAAKEIPTPTPTPPNYIQGFTHGNIPTDISGLIIQAANQYNIHPAVLASLIFSESGFNPQAINTGVNDYGQSWRDRGIAQINDLAHPDVTDTQAFDPGFAIPYSARLLDQYRKQMDNDLTTGIAAYRVGPGRARNKGPKGREKVKKVIEGLDPAIVKELGLGVGWE